jgi:hypothetical protein
MEQRGGSFPSGAEGRMLEPPRAAPGPVPRRRRRIPVDNAVTMGLIYYLLIVGMIVLASAERYRFFYGNF